MEVPTCQECIRKNEIIGQLVGEDIRLRAALSKIALLKECTPADTANQAIKLAFDALQEGE